jgi:hypothetical protein
MSVWTGKVTRMGQKALFDQRAMAEVLARQSGVITRSQVQDCAMSDEALRHRIRDGGPWQVVLPGVYVANTGALTRVQRELAAVLYAGTGSVLTGPAALVFHSVRAPRTPMVDVLIPHERRRRSLGFVQVHRTSRMPSVVLPVGEVRYVPRVRAVADTVRGLRDLSEVRAIVADAVQRGRVTLGELAEELDGGPAQGSARYRRVLAEVADGVRSAAEGDLHDLVRRERLPEPMYNPSLYAGQDFIAVPDAWWPDAGVAGEIDSRQWHLSPSDWERTMARGTRMSSQGIIVLRFPPSRLRTDGRIVAAEIRSALEAGRARGPLDIRAVPAR